MNDNIALASKCLDILCKQVGVVDTERFIHFIKAEAFDYTKWQREHYDNIPADELRSAIIEFNNEHPFNGAKAVTLR